MTARTHRGRRARSAAALTKFRALVERMLWPHFGSQSGFAGQFANDVVNEMQADGLVVRLATTKETMRHAP